MSHEHFDGASMLAFLEGNDEVVVLADVSDAVARCRTCAKRLHDVEAFEHLLGSPEWLKIWAEVGTSSYAADVRGMVALDLRMRNEQKAARAIVENLPSDDVAVWPHLLERVPATGALAEALLDKARLCHRRSPGESPFILNIVESILRRISPRLVGLEGDLWKERGNAYRHLARYEDALAALDRAEAVYGESPLPAYDQAFVHWGRGSVYYVLKRYREARAELGRAKVPLIEYGDDLRLAQIQLVEGGILFDEGSLVEARELFAQSAQIADSFGDEETLARAYANLATCDARLSAPTSLSYGREAIRRFDELDMRGEAVRLFWSLAQALVDLGKPDEALDYLREAAERFEQLHMVGEAAGAYLDTISILLEREDAEEASALARRLAVFFSRERADVDAAQAIDYLRQAASVMRATPDLARYVKAHVAARLNGETVSFQPPSRVES